MLVTVVTVGTVSTFAGGVGATASSASASGMPTAPGGTWGAAQQMTGMPSQLIAYPGIASISCPAAGQCAAVGRYDGPSAPGGQKVFVVNEVAGVWGPAREVPGFGALSTGGWLPEPAISCAAPGDCAAGGSYPAGNPRPYYPFVADETDGTWGKAQRLDTSELTGATAVQLTAISCASKGNCAATGIYQIATGVYGFVISETNGLWGKAEPVPGLAALTAGVNFASMTALSCASAGNCSAGGYTGAGGIAAFVVSETNGTWGTAEQVPGTANPAPDSRSEVTTVSCTGAGDCSAGGLFTTGGVEVAFVVTETDGVWGAAEQIPGLTAIGAGGPTVSVSCSSPGNCSAGGEYWGNMPQDSGVNERVFVATQTGGTWGDAQDVADLTLKGGENAYLTSLSCAGAGDCSAGGYFDSNNGVQGFLISETNGTWSGPHDVPAAPVTAVGIASSGVTSVSCGAPGFCSAAVWHTIAGGSGPIEQLLVNEATASGIVLGLPEPLLLTYGHEQPETVTAGVASPAGGTPTGTVVVALGGRHACTITLAAGVGSCRLAATSVPVGRYQLTATYSGDTTYLSSAISAPFKIAVTKAATATALGLSQASVAYGHEGAEHLTVKVTPQYAGTPAGKVVIRAGKITVCVITLNAGKGSCTLAARQLKAGSYTLTASYGGNADFTVSISPRKTLKVAK